MSEQDTIYAVATGHGVAGVGIIRLSGAHSWAAIESLTRKPVPSPRVLSRRWVFAANGDHLDDCLAVVFEQGASFTGEQAAEIHCHGSRAVQKAVLHELSNQPHCRLAEAGEFTRRAFDSGLMDLNQVEGLGDLIHAETEYQRRQALRVMAGAASDQTASWRASLVRAKALTEATIDWADEDVPEDVSPEVIELIDEVVEQMERELATFNRTERLREGFEVAIIGAPNVGKSTLINAIAGRTVAITSDIAGTTRDVIEARCDLGGLPVTFLDTAGLRESDDTIEWTGVEIARSRARAADLRLFLTSQDCPADDTDLSLPDDISVWSKSDLASGQADLQISAINVVGIDKLLKMVAVRLEAKVDQLSVFGHQRQFEIIQRCMVVLHTAKGQLDVVDAEVLAEHLRGALAELDSLTGRSAVEDVLGEVFSSFCLGK